MLIELSEQPSTEVFDVCVVGTGPAGITIALKLASAGKHVLLLEGGGHSSSSESQNIYAGETIGDPYFDLKAARVRCFGGTSNVLGRIVLQRISAGQFDVAWAAIIIGAIAAILTYLAVTLVERWMIPWYWHIHDTPE